ncbi:GNAT family protein [Cypionkella sp.]|uniref:GNAT family N-acetyltransferase n=1 Tax=Cypionkella sp. TaxID=2811411 RepID=UPI0026134367|nr:GNAT family protein [Cypionkella sp.]MDB5663990.1 family N-acetyltransferase [Cypionkella sp.]
MAENMQHWTPRQRPQALTLEGRFVRLEKLEARHTAELFAASATAEADVRFTWLPEAPPSDLASFGAWVEKVAQSEDPIFFAIIDKASGKVAGRQTLMRIDAVHGVVEIGNIYWGPLMARKPAATEALYLFAQYVFDTLGYRRFEWKCNDDNAPSKQAALRFGFQAEGVFRQHMVVKGLNRDTAWFAMIDKDWVKLKPAYEAWLAAENFDADGQQKRRLEDIRAELGA